MGNLGSKVRAIIVATLTLPSSESAIAGKALLPIVKPLFSAFVEHSLDIQNNLGLSVLDGDDEPIPFGDLQPDVQLEKALILLDLLRSIGLEYIGHDNDGFQFVHEHRELLANLLNHYKGKDTGWSECQKAFKLLKYNSGATLSVDDLATVCTFRDKHLIYIKGLHAGADGEADALKIKIGNVKVQKVLSHPKDWILSDGGKYFILLIVSLRCMSLLHNASTLLLNALHHPTLYR